MTVTVTRSGAATPTIASGRAMRLLVSAMDQPGIVHRITHVLHQLGGNVEDLTTRREPGAYTGTPLFRMELAMTLPADVPMRELRGRLEELCDAMNCDFELRPA
jgi:glycine cleavage system transcriptional repressor